MSEEEQLKLLATDGMLVKRPILVKDGRVLVGFKEDEWEENLRRIGFYLGKFIYILDAYDDIEKDKKKGCFNPFIQKETERTFDDWIKQLLMLAAVEFAKEFEKLPIIEKDVEILRNIIYSGVWTRYEEVKHRRNEKK